MFTRLDSPDNKRLDNRTGVERLMNSLASLPSLQELNTTEDQNWRGQIPVHPSGSVFLIGTNRTEHCGGVNLKRILIDLKGFEPDDDQPDTARQSDRKSSEASVLVTAPGLAEPELFQCNCLKAKPNRKPFVLPVNRQATAPSCQHCLRFWLSSSFALINIEACC